MVKKWLGNKSYTEYTSSTGGVGVLGYDATGAGASVNSGTNSVTINWSHTASGSNRAVLVFVMVGGVSASASTFTRSATYGGITMTSLGAKDGNSTNGWVEAFWLYSPPTGAQTVSATVSKASTAFGRVAGNSVSYTNASGNYTTLYATTTSAGTGGAWGLEWLQQSSYKVTGGRSVAMFATDTTSTITSTYTLNVDVVAGEPVPWMTEDVNRWTSNSGTTAGMTSCAISDIVASPYIQQSVIANKSCIAAAVFVFIESIGVSVPKGINGCYLTMIGAGGGGGSGRQGASASARFGGYGGGGGAVVYERYIPAEALSSTYSLYVPPIAPGGAASGTVAIDGNIGYRSSDVMFQSGNVLISCGSGHGGHGGSTAAATYGNDGGLTGDTSGRGAPGGVPAAGAGAAGFNTLLGNSYTGAPGGAGGGITTGNVAGAGGAGGDNRENSLAGGAGGVVGGASPGAGSALVTGMPGSGAGGGAASASGTPQAGANAIGYGAGGGGGGASLTGRAAGAGGSGGPAYARIMWDYR